MEETVTPSPEYLKGFNQGYLLSKELPELADKLSSVKSESDRTRGFQDGYKAYILEKGREQLRPRVRDQTKDMKSKDKSKDIDIDI